MEKRGRDNLFAVSCAIYVVILVAFVLIRIAGALGAFDLVGEQAGDIIFSILSQVIIMFLIPVIGISIYKRKNPTKITFDEFVHRTERGDFVIPGDDGALKHFGFNKTTGRVIMWSVALGVVMFFFNIFVSTMFNGILASLGHRGATGGGESSFTGFSGFLISMVLVAILPGLCEETSHRGLLLRGFIGRIGIMRAVSLSALLFGLMHLNIVQFFYAWILGYFMALMVIATKTIWSAVIIHFMNNGIHTYISFANANNWAGGGFLESFAQFMGGMNFIFYVAFFVSLYFMIVSIIHRFARENFIKKYAGMPDPPRLHFGRGMPAIKYYLSYGEEKNRTPLAPLERTLVYTMVFLGLVVTGMTLWWGFL